MLSLTSFHFLETALISIENFAIGILVHPYGMPTICLLSVLQNAHAYGI